MSDETLPHPGETLKRERDEALASVRQLSKELNLRNIVLDYLAEALADHQETIKKQKQACPRLQEALEGLAETGGWVTEWVTDEATGQRGPSTSNRTAAIAESALAGKNDLCLRCGSSDPAHRPIVRYKDKAESHSCSHPFHHIVLNKEDSKTSSRTNEG